MNSPSPSRSPNLSAFCSSSSYNSLSLPGERTDPVAPCGLTMDSASPTCLRSVTSLPFNRLCLIVSVNPRVAVPLMTANCYWRGSDELESLLRWR